MFTKLIAGLIILSALAAENSAAVPDYRYAADTAGNIHGQYSNELAGTFSEEISDETVFASGFSYANVYKLSLLNCQACLLCFSHGSDLYECCCLCTELELPEKERLKILNASDNSPPKM